MANGFGGERCWYLRSVIRDGYVKRIKGGDREMAEIAEAGREKNKIINTEDFIDDARRGKYREYVSVLNTENIFMENRRSYDDYDSVRFIGEAPLYVIQYYHPPNEDNGATTIYRYDASEKPEIIFQIKDSASYFGETYLPDELRQFLPEVQRWIQRFQKGLWIRTCERDSEMGF